jgi:hypothetical protein
MHMLFCAHDAALALLTDMAAIGIAASAIMEDALGHALPGQVARSTA